MTISPPTTARRPGQAMVVVMAFTVIYAPVHFIALMMFGFSAGRYDDSGAGVLPACTADSVSCSGPDVEFMVVSALLVLAGLALAGCAGQRAGRFAHPWRARLCLAAASAMPIAVVVAVLWPR